MKTIYNYHPDTGVFIGSGVADPSPLEPGVFLIPANATADAQPACGDGQRPVFRDGVWIIENIPQPYPAPVPTTEEIKASVLVQINAACEQAIAVIQSGYPASEVLSWTKQETEARAYVADPGAAPLLLDALAEARGIDKAELAARVILKADAFARYSGTAIGKRQALEDALNALPADATAEQIAAIAW